MKRIKGKRNNKCRGEKVNNVKENKYDQISTKGEEKNQQPYSNKENQIYTPNFKTMLSLRKWKLTYTLLTMRVSMFKPCISNLHKNLLDVIKLKVIKRRHRSKGSKISWVSKAPETRHHQTSKMLKLNYKEKWLHW